MKEELLKLCESEFHLADIVWENEPLQSSLLVRLCNEKLGWKKSTTYTILKKLVVKGILSNENSVVHSIVLREQVTQYASRNIVEKTFGGSLPSFVAAFLKQEKLTPKEARELQNLIQEAVRKDE